MLNALADSRPQAQELYPDEYPLGVAFSFPAGGQPERYFGQPGTWYAMYRMPIYPGKAYDVLLAHAGDPSRLRIYALDGNPFERLSGKYELTLRRMESGSSHNLVYETTIATSSDSTAKRIYLLLEWLPQVNNEMPVPVVLQAVSSEFANYMPEACSSRYWSWHNECQQPLNGAHIESPLQSEKHRNASDGQVPRPGITEQDRRNAPSFRLLPY